MIELFSRLFCSIGERAMWIISGLFLIIWIVSAFSTRSYREYLFKRLTLRNLSDSGWLDHSRLVVALAAWVIISFLCLTASRSCGG
jgi:hypothetical protein